MYSDLENPWLKVQLTWQCSKSIYKKCAWSRKLMKLIKRANETKKANEEECQVACRKWLVINNEVCQKST